MGTELERGHGAGEVHQLQTGDRSGSGCACPLMDDRTDQKEMSKSPADTVEKFTSVVSFLTRREHCGAAVGRTWTLESTQDLEPNSAL